MCTSRIASIRSSSASTESPLHVVDQSATELVDIGRAAIDHGGISLASETLSSTVADLPERLGPGEQPVGDARTGRPVQSVDGIQALGDGTSVLSTPAPMPFPRPGPRELPELQRRQPRVSGRGPRWRTNVSRSDHLRLSDVREAFRLLGELRELGAEPLVWRRHMLESLGRIIGVTVGMSAEGCPTWRPPSLVDVSGPGARDWKVLARFLVSPECSRCPVVREATRWHTGCRTRNYGSGGSRPSVRGRGTGHRSSSTSGPPGSRTPSSRRTRCRSGRPFTPSP